MVDLNNKENALCSWTDRQLNIITLPIFLKLMDPLNPITIEILTNFVLSG